MYVDPNNKEFWLAEKLVEEKGQNIFLTGKAGTGKTTFLRYLKTVTKKKFAVLAPTGVAAINAGGQTIHSFFGIDFRKLYLPDDERITTNEIYQEFRYNKSKKEVLKNLELLVIDEISMVRCELLDVIDRLLRVFGGGNSALPFGGKQVLLIGDPYQLPPVIKNDVRDYLAKAYSNFFFFGSQAFQHGKIKCVELKKIYRQKDDRFIDLLNRVRINNLREEEYNLLSQRVTPHFNFAAQDYVYLATHRNIVQDVNEKMLAQLPGQKFHFSGMVSGRFPESDMPTLKDLYLKEGAQIMFVKNDSGSERRFHNGKIGKIISLTHDQIIVSLEDGNEIHVERAQWEKIEYKWDSEKKKIIEDIVGTFTQYPLKLAWAITIHKSQGLTFEKVYADIEGAFTSGQAYVALSRCTSLEGLKLASRVPRSAIIVASEVNTFYKDLCECKSKEFYEPPQIHVFQSNKTFVKDGEAVELTWNVSGASRISISEVGDVPTYQNSVTVTPTKARSYVLTAHNEYETAQVSKSIRIEVDTAPPVITEFTSSDKLVIANTPFTIQWKVENAKSIKILPGDLEKLDPKLGRLKTEVVETTKFLLKATSFYGIESQQELTVGVVKVPEIKVIRIPSPTINIQHSTYFKPPKVELPDNLIKLPSLKNGMEEIFQSISKDKGALDELKEKIDSLIQKLNEL